MRRIVIALMGTVSGLVLVFAYDASQRSGEATAAASSPAPSVISSSPAVSPTGSSGSGSGAGSGSGTFLGDAVQTRWGPVQVQIVVKNGKITKATAVQYPNQNPHDQEINSWAIPQLEEATVAANSAQIDALSGATVTSGGYINSLQSALDKAHL